MFGRPLRAGFRAAPLGERRPALASSTIPPLPDWQSAGIYVLGLSPTYYTLGWPRVSGITSYEYSTNDGASWTSTGTTPYAEVTGRTASTTDLIRVRAINGAGSSEITGSVTLPGAGAATVEVRTIGTGGDYATPAAWAAASPDFGSTNVIWEGRLLNQEFVGAAEQSICILATNGTASRYMHLTVAPGAAFCDHENRRTNPLRYDASYGAALRVNMVGSTTGVVRQTGGYSRVSRVQIKSTGNNTAGWGGYGIHSSNSLYPVYCDQCLIETGTDDHAIAYNYGNHIASRCVGILVRPPEAQAVRPASTLLEFNRGTRSHHNTIVAVGGQLYAHGSSAQELGTQFKNTALFGCTRTHNVDVQNATTYPTYTNCATDASLQVPSGCAVEVAADCFEGVTVGTHDLRIKTGSPLIGAGVYDATYSVLDITNTRRPLVNPDIGAWQSL